MIEIMNYEQKYKEALERAMLWHKSVMPADKKAMVEDIFSELKESEDERIRKAIIAYIDHNKHNGVSNKEMIAWLEKQGEQKDKGKLAEEALKYVARQFMNWLDASTPEDKMCLSNMECEDIEDAFLKDDWARITHYIKKKLEKQGEKGPCIGCTNDKGCVTCENGNLKEIKIEPKFHPGDWVILNDTVAQILDKQKYGFVGLDIDGKDFFCNYGHTDSMRLWSIEDAKDGDVLSSNDGYGNNCIELIKSIKGEKIDFWFCMTNGNRWYEVFDGITPYTNFASRKDATPATKEQRELLFSKLKEAGYEWDAEKKELKKIESKKLNAAEVIDWIKTHGNYWLVVTKEINKVIAKFKEDFKL